MKVRNKFFILYFNTDSDNISHFNGLVVAMSLQNEVIRFHHHSNSIQPRLCLYSSTKLHCERFCVICIISPYWVVIV